MPLLGDEAEADQRAAQAGPDVVVAKDCGIIATVSPRSQ
jgi:hypothetical protein